MEIPTIEFLDQMEQIFSVRYPLPFRKFCERGSESVRELLSHAAAGGFITDLDTMKKINVRIGEEQWSDYETAIAGKVHSKDGLRLWGSLLPVYYDEGCVYGYYIEEQENEKIYVWSVHCIVGEYGSLDDFIRSTLK